MDEEPKSKGWGISSLVTGILSLLLFLAPYFGLPLAIFAVVAARQQDKVLKTGTAMGGRVTGIIGIVINATMLFLVIIFLVFFGEAFL